MRNEEAKLLFYEGANKLAEGDECLKQAYRLYEEGYTIINEGTKLWSEAELNAK
jgi:hypothetical protein